MRFKVEFPAASKFIVLFNISEMVFLEGVPRSRTFVLFYITIDSAQAIFCGLNPVEYNNYGGLKN